MPQLTRPQPSEPSGDPDEWHDGQPRKGLRATLDSLDPAAAFLSAIPMRARGTTVIAAPLFHAWGLAHLALGLILSSTLVLQRRFDPERTLALIEDHQADALVLVPVMMQRLLELDRHTRTSYDVTSLRLVAASGSALPGELATRFMDAFGDVLYNLYGSTEVAYATVASPADLRAAPATAGRPLPGTTIRLVDATGEEVPEGEVGRIFVGNGLVFGGYTGGGDKDRIGDLVATGDVGRFDREGRLFIEGRDDEMIISGGENVFPGEVEDLLSGHPAIREAAVVGVEDEAMGQRLIAYVVTAAKRGVRGGDQDAREGPPGSAQGPARCLLSQRATSQRDGQGGQTPSASPLRIPRRPQVTPVPQVRAAVPAGVVRRVTGPSAAAPRRGSNRRPAARCGPAERAAGEAAPPPVIAARAPLRSSTATPEALNRRDMLLRPPREVLPGDLLATGYPVALDHLVDEAGGRVLLTR